MRKHIKTFVIAVFTVSIFATGFTPSVGAADAVEATEPKADKAPRPYPFRGKIGKIDKEAKSITVPGSESSRVFYLTEKTKITKNGKPATLDDAVVGEEIAGSVLPDEDGKLMLNSVRFGPKPAEE